MTECIRRKSSAAVYLKVGRFHVVDSAVVISSISNCCDVETSSFKNLYGFPPLTIFVPFSSLNYFCSVFIVFRGLRFDVFIVFAMNDL